MAGDSLGLKRLFSIKDPPREAQFFVTFFPLEAGPDLASTRAL